jgi:hypothetical protein
MFQLEVFQNPYLPNGSGRVDAIFTVTAAADAAATGEAVEGLILDVSGSMKGHCIEAVKHAARKAIQLLDAETNFFVVAFSGAARVIVELSPATVSNKNFAEREIQRLEADGGTVMSDALVKAREQIQKKPQARSHVLFLTDGKNNVDDNHHLIAELAGCRDQFQADCRGVGSDWEPGELRAIAETLLGTAQIIPEPSGLESDFREVMEKAQGKTVGNVRLRLAMPKSGKTKLIFLKQMTPAILNLNSKQTSIDPHTQDFATGAWAKGDSHDFHAAFEVPPGAIGDEMLVCRPSVVYGQTDTPIKGPPILATWTPATDERSAIIHPQVAHYTNQVQIAADIREGLAARARGDIDAATQLLARAAKSARATGNVQVTEKLRDVVIQYDDGTIKLKDRVEKAKLMDLDLRSTITARAPKKPSA